MGGGGKYLAGRGLWLRTYGWTWVVAANLWLVVGGRGWSRIVVGGCWWSRVVVGGRGCLHDLLISLLISCLNLAVSESLLLKQFVVYYYCFTANFELLITQTGNCNIESLIKIYETKSSRFISILFAFT